VYQVELIKKEGAKMKYLLVSMMILLLCGCSEKLCTRSMSAYNTETKTERIVQVEGKCQPDNSFKWYHVLLFPIATLAAVSDTQQAVTNSPNYQAGGSAYKDYTQPQKQPQPQPSYQQQQINNGNGAGLYGNYPKY
jgi:Flp pilus assembly protein TadD